MANLKKRKKVQQQVQSSPKRYLMEKARHLPLGNCYINDSWRETRMAQIFIERKMPSGRLIIGTYMVDLLCLGVKNTFFMFNLSETEWAEKLKDLNIPLEPCSYALAHNIIYGANDFAEDAGLHPQKDFAISKYILDEDSEDIVPDEDIEFGKDDMHYYMSGPHDNVNFILATLKRNLGEGNFKFVIGLGGPTDNDWDDEDEDWEVISDEIVEDVAKEDGEEFEDAEYADGEGK